MSPFRGMLNVATPRPSFNVTFIDEQVTGSGGAVEGRNEGFNYDAGAPGL